MNLTHVHLLLNHLPIVGSLCGLGLLAWALWRRSQELKRVALGVFLLAALLAIPVYATGEPAEHGVQGLPGVATDLIERHESVASVALGGLLGVGVLAASGLFRFRGSRPVPAWFGALTLCGALVVAGLMGWTASLGGKIHHPEIRSGSAGTGSFQFDRD